jgi:hypothetical protein
MFLHRQDEKTKSRPNTFPMYPGGFLLPFHPKNLRDERRETYFFRL